jgi:hypothetical protein
VIQATLRQFAPVLALGLLLAGCASDSTRPDQTSQDQEDKSGKNMVVEKRALERWDFLVNRQAEKAYDYLTPGFRATKSREAYAAEMNNRPVQWAKVYPYNQSCDKPDVCILNLQVDANTDVPGVRERVQAIGFVEETWIQTRGKWYYLPDTKSATGSQ